ncbi:probable glucan endo-1,3-beta-glucosidase A6 [Solanum tuberosum]|uniref:probable glucan endo-1,3-beta-glucosidase A6 n=1 Tax=Solanum tuberosum TaxID=4113 RepID=UPI0003D24BCA|nr:PREDICTED: probable glucan endo-1,3-beta-glucosidase A6 [Solanum tuberosum]
MFKEKIMVEVTFAIAFLSFLLFSNVCRGSIIGINYGRVANNLPSPYDSIELLKNMKAGRVKIYDANPEILRLLSGTNLQVSIMVPNNQISIVAANQSAANQWVRDNVLPYYPNTMIRYILVGNEVLSNKDDQGLWYDLIPAMNNIRNSIDQHNIHNIKIGTPFAMDILETSFPPSSGEFRLDISRNNLLMPLLRFLNWTKSYFFLDAYPYFSWSQNTSSISLDYALFQGSQTYVDPVSGYVYTNLLDQMLDSVVFAMQKLGFNNIRVAIAETGWPNGGDYDEIGANIYNAATYNRNLIRRVVSKPPIGTPARPGLTIPTFIFSLYDENQKEGPGTERHWGMLHPNGRPMYDIDLTGQTLDSEFIDLPQPTNNGPFHGKLWCVVTNDHTMNEMDLGQALEFACRRNETCDEISPGKSCYQPVSIVSHANYAFSSYWAKYKEDGETCYFNGLAVQTNVDPSHGSCKFPYVSL